VFLALAVAALSPLSMSSATRCAIHLPSVSVESASARSRTIRSPKATTSLQGFEGARFAEDEDGRWGWLISAGTSILAVVDLALDLYLCDQDQLQLAQYV
jgi:hypothetical protein